MTMTLKSLRAVRAIVASVACIENNLTVAPK